MPNIIVNSSRRRGRPVAWGLLAVSIALMFLSPRILSGDSAPFVLRAVEGNDLIHTHHLIYGALLRAMYWIGSALGFALEPYRVLRLGSLCLAAIGLIATYRALRLLRIGRVPGALFTVVAGTSGVYWQFATQAEAYVPAYAFLTLSVCGCLASGKAIRGTHLSQYEAMEGERRRWVRIAGAFILAAGSLILASLVHQLASLAAPSLVAMTFQEARRRNACPRRKALFVSVALVAIAGLVSFVSYAIGWRLSGDPISFFNWMTRYAHLPMFQWGETSNFSVRGGRMLLLGWGSSWFNADPFRFHSLLPARWTPLAMAWAGFLLSCAALLIARAARHRSFNRPIVWILLWIVAVETFILWWLPGLKNFQMFVLFPQVALGAFACQALGRLAAGAVAREPAKTLLLRGIPILVPSCIAAGLLVFQMHFLVLPGLRNPHAPEGDLRALREAVRPVDLCVLDHEPSFLFRALLLHRNTALPYELGNPDRFPSWNSSLADPPRVAFHHSAIFLTTGKLASMKRNYADTWEPILYALAQWADGWERLRGRVVYDEGRLLAAVFGVDSTLPQTGSEVLEELVRETPKTFPNSYPYVGTFLLKWIDRHKTPTP